MRLQIILYRFSPFFWFFFLQIFSEGAKAHFSPLELVKEVRFGSVNPANPAADEEVVEATEIVWKDKENNPVAKVLAEREKEEDEDLGPWSFFEWFTKEPWPESRPDIGEHMRREIWHSPINFFLGGEDALCDDDADLSEELDESESDNDNEDDE